MAYERVLALAELPVGSSRLLTIERQQIALFNVGGRVYAIDNICPHRMGPLVQGRVENGVVACPWHGWRFDVRTGASVSHRGLSVACYGVEVRDGEIYLEVPAVDEY